VKQIVQAVCGPRLPRCCSVVLNSSDVLADARIYDSGRARCSGFYRREPGRAVHRAGNQLSDHGTAAQAVHCCQRFQACGQRRRDFCGHRDGGRAGMSHATRFTGTQPKRLLDPPAWSALEPHVPTRARLVASAPTTTGWREISDARLVIYADVGHLPSRASETVCDPPLARRWPDLAPLPEGAPDPRHCDPDAATSDAADYRDPDSCSSSLDKKWRRWSATVRLASPRGNTGASSLPLTPRRCRTPITSTRLPPSAGVALIS
jgi:hypothetical protein